MHSPEGNFTGNDTTSEIILFEVPSNRHSFTGEVGVVGRECPRAKAESKKQCVDPESTSVQMDIGWRWSKAHQRRDKGYTKRIWIGKSRRDSQFVLSLGSHALVFQKVLREQSLLFLQSS